MLDFLVFFPKMQNYDIEYIKNEPWVAEQH